MGSPSAAEKQSHHLGGSRQEALHWENRASLKKKKKNRSQGFLDYQKSAFWGRPVSKGGPKKKKGKLPLLLRQTGRIDREGVKVLLRIEP